MKLIPNFKEKIYNTRFVFQKNTLNVKKEIKRKVFENILFKKKIKSYSGLRHSFKLPVRGQRTQTNAKTCKKHKKLK